MGIRNPKVCVTGASDEELVKIKGLLKEKGIDLVVIPDEADAIVTPDWLLDKAIPYKKLHVDIPESIDITECCSDNSYIDGNQHWRGGSRGKGGKIKYARR